MSLLDSIFSAGKYLIGMLIGGILSFIGLMITGTSQGRILSLIVGIALIIVGAGLILWGEQHRRSALAV